MKMHTLDLGLLRIAVATFVQRVSAESCVEQVAIQIYSFGWSATLTLARTVRVKA